MSNNLAQMIASYVEGPRLLRASVRGMSREQLRARPIAGKWSTLEVVCHLVDSEQAWCHRMKRVIAEEKPLLIGYDESRFTATLGYHDRDLDEELDLLDAQRDQMARVLRGLPDAAWLREGVHNERGLITLETMVEVEAEHVVHHIRHILDKRKALGLPDLRGPRPA
jgi:uncharacterized damage-inducible protein DinB